jgi:predicted Zn finger-like uncharacterized protein
MATLLNCPECKTALRLAAAPPAGRRIRCPKCGATFAPEAAAGASEPPRPVAATKPLSLPDEDEHEAPPARQPKLPPKPAAKARRDEEPEDDADEEREEKPRPAARRRAVDDDDDDEDDRRPAGRKRPADEDDRPRKPRKRKPEPKKSNGLLIGLIAGGAVAVLAIGGLVWALAGRNADKPDAGANAANSAPTAPSGPNQANAGPGQVNGGTNPTPAAALSSQELLDRTRRATALIRVEAGNRGGSGSGFLVRVNPEAAYVVTNYHVISIDDEPQQPNNPGPGFPGRPPGFPGRPPGFPGRPPGFPGFGPPGFGPQQPAPKVRPKVTVVLNSGTAEEQAHSAEVVAIDPEADLATLRVAGARNVPAPLDVSQEAPVRETMPVRIFGFPGGNKNISINEGKVIQLRRDDAGALNDVQIAGSIQPGNSGGPVVDSEGRLIGIAVATVRDKNIGFAIPAAQLDHMLKGSVLAGLVFQVRPQGAQLQGHGELWVLDRKSKVMSRDTFQQSLGQSAGATAAGEYVVLAALNDPMHKITAIKAHFAKSESVPDKPGPAGWAPLPGATAIALTVRDDEASARFRLPAGAVADDTFAFQFSYVNADGQTVLTQPHPLRLSFPKNPKSVTLRITVSGDEPTLRYVEDMVRKAFPGTNIAMIRTPQGIQAEINPVDDPKAAAAKITFGEVTGIAGRTISVSVPAVELPLPTDQEVTLALNDLKTKDEPRRQAGANRLAKMYRVLPDRREEVAKVLEAAAAEKNIWVQGPAISALSLWAGPENVPGLIRIMESVDWPTQNAICPVLGRLKDPTAAPAIAKLLPGLGNRGAASAALKAIGPPAEKSVIPYLTNKDGFTASEACNILKEIGTAASIQPLQDLLKSKPGFQVESAAAPALKAVQERAKKG